MTAPTITASNGVADAAPRLPATSLPGTVRRPSQARRLLALHWGWWVELLAPLRVRVRAVGTLRAAPASVVLAVSSLAITGVVRLPSPVQDAAYALLTYRGQDFYSGEVWKLPLSGLLAQSWPQWAWTLFIAAVVFAPLEVRIGGRAVLMCVFLSQISSTSVIALLAPVTGHADLMSHPDFGTSCLVVGAAAALAWVRRSLLLSGVIGLSLAVDAVLSAPTTAIEHCVAVSAGALVLIAARHARARTGRNGNEASGRGGHARARSGSSFGSGTRV
jgi:hypothetical protein